MVLQDRFRGFLEAVPVFPFIKLLERLKAEYTFRANPSSKEEMGSSLQAVEAFPEWWKILASHHLCVSGTLGGVSSHLALH